MCICVWDNDSSSCLMQGPTVLLLCWEENDAALLRRFFIFKSFFYIIFIGGLLACAKAMRSTQLGPLNNGNINMMGWVALTPFSYIPHTFCLGRQRMPSTHIMSRRLLKFVLDMKCYALTPEIWWVFYCYWVTLSMSAMWFHLQYHKDVPTHTLSKTKYICGLSECINTVSLIRTVLSVLSLSLLYT